MDLQEKLAQCRVDKKVIEAKERELLNRIKESKLKQRIPFARFVPKTRYCDKTGRLILHLTPEFVNMVKKHKGHVVSLGRVNLNDDIAVCCNTPDRHMITRNSLICQYENVQILIN